MSKIEIAKNLMAVTDWLPDYTDNEYLLLRRVFILPEADGSQKIHVLTAYIDFNRAYACLYESEHEEPGVTQETTECTVFPYAHELGGAIVTNENLADLLNRAVACMLPLALEDTITPELVARARGLCSWEGQDDLVYCSNDDYDEDTEDDVAENDCECPECSAARGE